MKKERSRADFVDYFIEKLFYFIQCNPCDEYFSFSFIRERANFAADIYFTALAGKENPSYALEKALLVLFYGFGQNK